MKTTKKAFQFLVILLLLSFGVTSCNKSEQLIDPPASNIKSEKNAAEYAKLLSARANFKGYVFNISEIKRTDNILKVTVEGDCDTEAYKVIWDGVINFTEPTDPNMVLGSMNLVISHESTKGYSCKAIISHTIEIDLKLLLGNAYTPTINVIISNASKVDDKMVNPNGGVTTVKK